MLVPVRGLGEIGMVKDKLAHMLPLTAWSDAKNVDFRLGYAQKREGRTLLGTPPVAPYAFLPAPVDDTNYWISLGLEKIYCFLGSVFSDITRVSGDYTGGVFDLWLGDVFNGLPVMTNGVDLPQVWSPVDTGTRLVDLPNWPATARCKVLRGFKNFLVALDVTKSGVRDRRLVKWSHPADPGAVPTSWDEEDPTKDAGEISLAEGTDALLDCLSLGNANIVYTAMSTWAMQHVGGTYIFDFHKIFDNVGALSIDCAKSLGNRHFVVTQNDFVVHDGARWESVAGEKVRDWFFNNLNSSAYFLTRVIPFYKRQEMWICFPTVSAILDKVLIWNWANNTWTVHDLPNVRAVHIALYSPTYTIDSWNAGYDFAATWDSENVTQWGDPRASRFTEAMLISQPNTDGVLISAPSIFQDNSVSYESYVERTGLPIAGIKQGQIVMDEKVVKNYLSVWPLIDAADGTEVILQVGTQMFPGSAVSWGEEQTFVVGTDLKVDIDKTGRYFAIRLKDEGSAAWKLIGYDLDVEPTGLL